jgi:hypothetical protein
MAWQTTGVACHARGGGVPRQGGGVPPRVTCSRDDVYLTEDGFKSEEELGWYDAKHNLRWPHTF